ncbi:PHD finger protein 20 isoform X2 [Lingula anatina]|uniref:PHD finger protein 20 isoform X2 n=1 Tax=Lingula anatina TaxID=7574 RepID=A0A1S3J5V7_LINAN|nr:PHD finger protein 20 isoform X2 [Lingula anatina]|eukprot:XP_013405802.1 PHD finger protein 20 isoform X2 [Lingula anatina]
MASKEQDTSSEGIKAGDMPNPSERSSRKRTSSTSSRKSSITTPPSSRRNSLSTPKSPGSRKSTPTPSKSGGTPDSNKKPPNRAGITWKPGEKLEAKDFLQKWYPAKIVEIDQKEEEVLIHFEGWNSRFDEWLEMTSERLRPITRHSERKDKPVQKVKKAKYKISDVVLAKWSDCRMYPAKVTDVLHDNMYEVMYYDGIRKVIQNINIRPLPPEMQDQEFHIVPPEATVVNPLMPTLSKEDRRLLKKKERRDFTNSPGFKKKLKQHGHHESTEPKERKSTETKEKEGKTGKTAVKQKDQASVKKTVKVEDKVSQKREKPDKITQRLKKEEKQKRREKRREERLRVKKEALKAKGRKTDYAKFLKRKKLLIGGTFQAKRKFQDVQKMRKKKLKEEHLKRQKKEKVVSSDEDIDSDGNNVEPSSLEQNTPPLSPQSRRMNSAVIAKKKAKQAVTPSPPTKNTPPETPKYPEGKVKRKGLGEQKKIRRKRRIDSSPDSAGKKKKLKFYAEVLVPATDPAPKEFVVKKDHNQYKCIFTDCDKSYRKQSLLDYHLKYYHTEDGTPIQPPPPRQRKKTISMCSNESEVSILSDLPLSELVSKPAKKKRMSSAESERKRHLSAMSTDSRATVEYQDDTACLDTAEGSVHSFTADQDGFKSTEDTMDMLDMEDGQEGPEELSDEVVNCICMLNEENGLMIQCECCMCWQHADCLNVTADTLPSKYVCSICQNPVGVRESARFIWDQDMFKTGQLARFACNSLVDTGRKSPFMLATNNLLGDMHNINLVLKGLKQKIKLLNSKDDPDLDLWARELERRREIEKERMEEELRLEEETGHLEEEEEYPEEGNISHRFIQGSEELPGPLHSGMPPNDLQNGGVDLTGEKVHRSESVDKEVSVPEKTSDLASGKHQVGNEGSAEQVSLKERETEDLAIKPKPSDPQGGKSTLPLPRSARNNSSLDSNEEIDVIGLSPTQKTFPSVPSSTSVLSEVDQLSNAGQSQQTEETSSSDKASDGVSKVVDNSTAIQAKAADSEGAAKEKLPTVGSTSQDQSVSAVTKTVPSKSDVISVSASSLPTPQAGLGEYKLSPVPSRVKLVGSSVWTPVAKNLTTLDKPQENNRNQQEKSPPAETGPPAEQEAPSGGNQKSSDTSIDLDVEEDRHLVAEQRLREHIHQLQDQLEKKLDSVEQQVDFLEAEIIGGSSSQDDPLEDVAQLKKSLHSILFDLSKVKRMALYH